MASYPACPFYEEEQKGILYCEGAKVHFPTDKDRGMWMKLHCCSSDYKICKFYNELMEKYDSDN